MGALGGDGADRGTDALDHLDQASDLTLVVGVARRSTAALAEIYSRHGEGARALAGRTCGDDAAADVVHDVFLHLWDHPGSYDADGGPLRTQLLAATHRRSRAAAEQAAAGSAPSDPNGGVPGAQVHHLPSPEREALALALTPGVTCAQVALLLGQTEGTIRRRLRTGLARLHGSGVQAWPPPP